MATAVVLTQEAAILEAEALTQEAHIQVDRVGVEVAMGKSLLLTSGDRC